MLRIEGEKMKEFFQKVADMATYIYNNHLPLVLLGIILLVVIIVFSIVLSKFLSKKKEIKTINENIKNQSTYTQQEIDNIANNVADKTKFISSIPPEKIVEEKTTALEETAVTKTTKKSTKKKDSEPTKTTKEKSTKKSTKTDVIEDKKSTTTTTEKAKTTTKKATKTTSEDKKVTTTTTTEKPKKTSEDKKTTTTKSTTASENKVTETAPAKKSYTGKWKIKQENSKYFAELHASNGGILLRTETYTSLTGVKSGIETIKKNIDDGNFTISSDKYGHYRFKLFSKLNRLICISEDYSSRAKCDSGIASVKRFAKTAYVLIEDDE